MESSVHGKKAPTARAASAAPAAASARWRTVEEAAAFLSMPVRVLREELARNAKTQGDAVEARFDGIFGRKIGRRWKVWLSEKWTAPEHGEPSGRSRGKLAPAVSAESGGETLAHGRA